MKRSIRIGLLNSLPLDVTAPDHVIARILRDYESGKGRTIHVHDARVTREYVTYMAELPS